MIGHTVDVAQGHTIRGIVTFPLITFGLAWA